MNPPLAPFAALAFDLDGTLADSRRDLANAINTVRAARDLPPHDLAAIEGMVGEGLTVLVRRAFRELGQAGVPEALAAFLVEYERGCLETTRPYPGIEELLAAAAGRWPLAVLTNKPERLAVKVIEGLGLAGRFRTVVGGDSLPVRKPDPATLLLVAGRLRVPVAALPLIGDSRVDLATARAAGAPAVAVTWGYGRLTEEDLAGADGAAGSVAELAALLSLPASRGGGRDPRRW
ncbi:MAG TPA: HAD hydrolase-like protein [Thermoanaerobaculia bacterium]|nr:HAD hydrolase-like protein [Thermoanaerobaculia bacterium]